MYMHKMQSMHFNVKFAEMKDYSEPNVQNICKTYAKKSYALILI